jgi:hypothetical protein
MVSIDLWICSCETEYYRFKRMCKYNAKVMLIVKVKGYDYKIRKVFIYNIFTEYIRKYYILSAMMNQNQRQTTWHI